MISHCGAGIILECLRSKRNEGLTELSLDSGTVNIAVVNDTLMNNHQTEIGDALHKDGYNICTTTSKILDEVESVLSGHTKLNIYPEA